MLFRAGLVKDTPSLILPDFLENFLGLHEIYSISLTNQCQLIWKIIFHSVRPSALWRGVRHAVRWMLTPKKYYPESCTLGLIIDLHLAHVAGWYR